MDLKFPFALVGNDIAVTSGFGEKIQQRLLIRLKSFTDTWAYNLDYGVDYFGSVFGKGRTKAAVDAVMRRTIEQEKYVDSLSFFESSLNGRKYTLKFGVNAVAQTETVVVRLLMNQDGIFLTDQNGKILEV